MLTQCTIAEEYGDLSFMAKNLLTKLLATTKKKKEKKSKNFLFKKYITYMEHFAL